MAKAGRCREPAPLWGLWVGPAAAVLQSLTVGHGLHICILAPVPLERLLPQAGQPLLLSATFLLLRLYFNKKKKIFLPCR